MLHAKFQDQRTFDSREDVFLKVFTIYGHDGHLGHVTLTVFTQFMFPVPKKVPHEICL